MKQQVLSLVLLGLLTACSTWQPYWKQTSCIADDAKIYYHYQQDISTQCDNLPNLAGCTIRHCSTASADIYISTLTKLPLACVKYHEYKHAKGFDHLEGVTDCNDR